MNLYEEIGGAPAVEAAVTRFYERVTADPALERFFQNMDLRGLKVHQVAFLTFAMGGPAQYAGRAMDRAHAELKIEQRHFDAVARHLVGTLTDLSVPHHLIHAVIERIAPLAPQVVNTPSGDAATA
jgi:hemoglobin